jgi:hypothetical protein
LIIRNNNSEKQIEAIEKIRASAIAAGQRAPSIEVVDARPKQSASKY